MVKKAMALSLAEREQIRQVLDIMSFQCIHASIKESSVDNANGLTNTSSLAIPRMSSCF
jgi:hypothetical protein